MLTATPINDIAAETVDNHPFRVRIQNFASRLGVRTNRERALAACFLIFILGCISLIAFFGILDFAHRRRSPISVVLSQSPAAPTTSPTSVLLSPSQLFRRVAPSVFLIEVMDSKGVVIATGSAVAVATDRVVTNKHVASQGKLKLRHGDQVWTAKDVISHPTQDLALLVVSGLNVPTVDFESRVSVGDRVYAVGAPEGLELTLSEGLISSLRETKAGQVIQTSAAISPGSSGGGLFDARGRLIGITTGILEEGQNLNFALPSELVRAFLDNAVEPPPITRYLPNGTEIIEPRGTTGLGELYVDNGTDHDATIKLIDGNHVRRWVYVKAKSKVTIKKIAPCSCRVLFSSGIDWDKTFLKFIRDRSFTRFENTFGFSETPEGDQIKYDVHKITLHKVPQGNAPTDAIDEQAFDAGTIS